MKPPYQDPLHQVLTTSSQQTGKHLGIYAHHADVVSIQQNLWQLGLAARVVAGPVIRIQPILHAILRTYNSVTSSRTISICLLNSLWIKWTRKMLTDVVIEAEESAAEFYREVR